MNYRRLRAEIIWSIREFFHAQGFLETDTSSLVLSPGMEPHIRPLSVVSSVKDVYLHTSPEFAMKKILARGESKIFQIAKVFRDEPLSSTHHPEFSMLEWYRCEASYFDVMNDVDRLFDFLRNSLKKHADLPAKHLELCKRLTVKDAFLEYVGIELREKTSTQELAEACVSKGLLNGSMVDKAYLSAPASWDDCFFLLLMNSVEPAMKRLNAPVILHDWPVSQAALSNLRVDELGDRWAMRFEVYFRGFELANAFDELTDPGEQRRRFEKDMKLRESLYGDSFKKSPIDEAFLKELGLIGKAAGIALGVDRLVMALTGAEDIRDVLWTESYFR